MVQKMALFEGTFSDSNGMSRIDDFVRLAPGNLNRDLSRRIRIDAMVLKS